MHKLRTNGLLTDDGAAGGTDASEYVHSIAIDTSGRILVTGEGGNQMGGSSMVIWCYESNGTPCGSFGTNGILTHNGSSGGNAYGNSIILEESGRILVAGSSINAAYNFDMAIWCYESDGTPCTNFGTNGLLTHDGAAGGTDDRSDFGWALFRDPSGRILVAGSSLNPVSREKMVIWRYAGYNPSTIPSPAK